ncbi:hypothetical protein CCUS01_15463 [Colletotrichum cuscutae]|uniref:Uncharacterized protein n=1 Tax=Colletotrichum cuscutae TaxID=1209917 RepID=A0AAI9Y759_9PEZI|nr:hypothetical protein CCUS01_15463 [Colletotrichum cuscutae]
MSTLCQCFSTFNSINSSYSLIRFPDDLLILRYTGLKKDGTAPRSMEETINCSSRDCLPTTSPIASLNSTRPLTFGNVHWDLLFFSLSRGFPTLLLSPLSSLKNLMLIHDDDTRGPKRLGKLFPPLYEATYMQLNLLRTSTPEVTSKLRKRCLCHGKERRRKEPQIANCNSPSLDTLVAVSSHQTLNPHAGRSYSRLIACLYLDEPPLLAKFMRSILVIDEVSSRFHDNSGANPELQWPPSIMQSRSNGETREDCMIVEGQSETPWVGLCPQVRATCQLLRIPACEHEPESGSARLRQAAFQTHRPQYSNCFCFVTLDKGEEFFALTNNPSKNPEIYDPSPDHRFTHPRPTSTPPPRLISSLRWHSAARPIYLHEENDPVDSWSTPRDVQILARRRVSHHAKRPHGPRMLAFSTRSPVSPLIVGIAERRLGKPSWFDARAPASSSHPQQTERQGRKRSAATARRRAIIPESNAATSRLLLPDIPASSTELPHRSTSYRLALPASNMRAWHGVERERKRKPGDGGTLIAHRLFPFSPTNFRCESKKSSAMAKKNAPGLCFFANSHRPYQYLARGRSPCAPLTLGSFSNSHNFKAQPVSNSRLMSVRNKSSRGVFFFTDQQTPNSWEVEWTGSIDWIPPNKTPWFLAVREIERERERARARRGRNPAQISEESPFPNESSLTACQGSHPTPRSVGDL